MPAMTLADYFDGGYDDANLDADTGLAKFGDPTWYLNFPDTNWDITDAERAAYRRGYIKAAREIEPDFWNNVTVPEGFGDL